MLLELYEGSAYNTISYFANDFTLAKEPKHKALIIKHLQHNTANIKHNIT